MRLRTLALFLMLAAACEPPEAPATAPDRDTFVATWIDLRMAALASPDGRIDPGRRDEVLRDHGVTEADLLDFVEAHGRDVAYMREVWAEVEARMDSLQLPASSPR